MSRPAWFVGPLAGLFMTASVLQAQTATSAHQSPSVQASADTDTTDTPEISEHPPVFSTGVSGRAGSYRDGHTERGIGVILRYAPKPWMALSFNPSYVRATDTAQTTTAGKFALSSLPMEISASHGIPGPGSPDISAALDASFPVAMSSDSGTKETTVGASLGLGFSPSDAVYLDVSAWHGLYGTTSGTMVRTSSSSLGAGMSVSAVPRLTLSGSLSADVGHADSGSTLGRSVGGGISYAIHGPLTLAIDGSHRLAGDGPNWSVSVGIGTAFAGVASVGPASPLGRLVGATQHLSNKARGKSSTSGKGKSGP